MQSRGYFSVKVTDRLRQTSVGGDELADQAVHLGQDLAGRHGGFVLQQEGPYGAASRTGQIDLVEEAAVQRRHFEP